MSLDLSTITHISKPLNDQHDQNFAVKPVSHSIYCMSSVSDREFIVFYPVKALLVLIVKMLLMPK